MGRQGKRKSLNALACAYEAGIIHFDVARSYGFGEAEKIVGQFIRNKRDQVCLVTKFGILPQPINPLRKLAKPILRILLDTIPSMSARVRRLSNQFLSTGNFSVETARNSLHTSLTNLGVQTIDLLLLHECTEQTPISDDLFDFLDRCVTEGKIRYYGLATDPASASTVLELFPDRTITAIQTPLNPTDAFEQLEHKATVKARIVHSVGALQPILSASLNKTKTAAASLPDEISIIRFSPFEAMPLLLRYASYKSQGGVTLVSSFNSQHITQNACAVATPLPDNTIRVLNRLLFSSS